MEILNDEKTLQNFSLVNEQGINKNFLNKKPKKN